MGNGHTGSKDVLVIIFFCVFEPESVLNIQKRVCSTPPDTNLEFIDLLCSIHLLDHSPSKFIYGYSLGSVVVVSIDTRIFITPDPF